MNDDRLREHFASLRRAEEARAPSFERVIGRPPRRSNRGWWGVGGAASALAVVTVVLVRMSHPHGPRTIAASAPMLADWRAPTDFLLDTPGRELLHTIPDLGRWPATGFGPHPPTRMTTPAPRAGREHS
jgi:hypothetical protein